MVECLKKLFAAVLCVLLAGLCACGRAEPEAETTRATAQATTTAATTTTEPPTMEPIECPATYRDAPKDYKPILDALYATALARNDNRDWDWAMDVREKIVFLPNWVNSSTEELGYAIVDINRDGILELLLLCKGSLFSLFTLEDTNPVFLLGDWGDNCHGRFAADGTLYVTHLIGSASGSTLASYRLEPGASKLTEIESYYFHFMYDDPFVNYKNASGEGKHPYTEKEFEAYLNMYTNPPNPMQFNFIPIEQF